MVCVVVITSQSGVGSVVLRAAELIEQSCVCVCVCVCVCMCVCMCVCVCL